MKNSENIERGFTLIELMIGLALGLIASLAIFTTITTFEAQRRTTAGGADMQQNGLLALYFIEQDVRMAGFGLIDPTSFPGKMPCVQVNSVSIAPVSIVDGGTGSDTLTTHRLDSDTGGIVTGGQAAQLTSALGVSPPTVDFINAIHPSDYLLIPDANKNCTQLQATSSSPGQTASSVPATTTGIPAEPVKVINLGHDPLNPSTPPSFPALQYRINASNLEHSTDGGTTWSSVAANIVNMQVQYGVAAAGAQPVTCWTDATGTACNGTNWANPSAADIARIKAIRVAIVARSSQRTTNVTTTTNPISWTQPATTPVSSAAPPINLNISVGADWGHYRYKVYQTIIPIRNVILGNL